MMTLVPKRLTVVHEAQPCQLGVAIATHANPKMSKLKSDSHSFAIIGSSSGAFVAAIRAAKSGAQITMIESGDIIGGTCVNVDCAPFK